MKMRLDVGSLLGSLYEGCPDAIVVYDRDGNFVACNDAARHLWQCSEGALPALEPSDEFRSALQGYVQHFETELSRDDGDRIPIEMHLYPARPDEGEIVGVFAQARDRIALRAAERALELNQERFRSLFEYHPDAVMALDSHGAILRVNVALEATTGYYGEQLIAKSWTELIAPECRSAADDSFRLAARGEATEIDVFLLDRLGNRIDVQMKLVPLRAGEHIEGAYAIAKNVVAQRSAEREIAQQGACIRELYLAAAARGDSIETQVDKTLDLGCRMFGFDYGYVTRFDESTISILNAVGEGAGVIAGAVYPKENALSRHLSGDRQSIFIPDLDESPWHEDPARGTAPWRSYFATKLLVGSREFGAMVFASRHPRPAGISETDRDLLQMMALFVAAALERAQHSERIAQLAFYDALTGLPNRVLFNDRIRQTMGAAKRYNRGFAVMYLDLDDFKKINDRFGHPTGDLVLKKVAERLLQTLRESDTVARFGGDEFVILQPVVNGSADSADLARKIVGVMQPPLEIDEQRHNVHTSIGIALYPQDGSTAEELMDHADRALYRAKRAGRNRWTFYNDEATRKDWPFIRPARGARGGSAS